MKDFIVKRFPSDNQIAVRGGLIYGLGWGIGTAATRFIINNVMLFSVPDSSAQAARLLFGILFAFFVAGLGAFIAGLVGGYYLPTVRREHRRWGYAWHSALVMGILYGVVLYPVGVILPLLMFYASSGEVSLITFGVLFTIFGIIFGSLVGLFLAASTVGRHGMGRIVRASTVGFAFGGAFLGFGVRQFLYSFNASTPNSEQSLWLLIGQIIFGFAGGYTLTYAYYQLANQATDYEPDSRRLIWIRRIVALALVLFFMFGVFRPLLVGLADFLTPVSASLDSILDSNTIGTHWAPDTNLTENSAGVTLTAPDIAANVNGSLGLAFARHGSESDVIFVSGARQAGSDLTRWTEAVTIPTLSQDPGITPQVAVDGRGLSHLVWIVSGDADGAGVYTSQCAEMGCTAPSLLSDVAGLDCAGSSPTAPTIAVNAADTIMVVWQTTAAPAYVTWQTAAAPTSASGGCLTGTNSASLPDLAATPDGFALTYATDGSEIHLTAYQGGWQASETVGNGRPATIHTDSSGEVHLAWCQPEQGVTYWRRQGSELVPDTVCSGRVELGQDSNGHMHLVWFAPQVTNNLDVTGTAHVLMESVREEGKWQTPAIIANPGTQSQFSLAGDAERLYLARSNVAAAGNDILYTAQQQYNCEDASLNRFDAILLEIAQRETYRPPGTIVPYCQNRFDMLLYTPNPLPAYSDLAPTPNGAFDYMFEVARQAEYEFDFSTMWYDADANGKNDSPGALLAETVADLYEQVANEPERYPRGMTVRILLGNPPELAKEDFTNQLWNVLNDLRDAGVPELVNEEIGWRVEVADFGGAFPHGHTKSMIVDGKTAVSAGYNMSYEHFPADNPSGKGADRNDLGIMMTGPVAQDALRMFDDLWSDSDQRVCDDLDPFFIIWQATCRDVKATADHVPEVLKYYLPGSDANAFSMHRTEVFSESDSQVAAALGATQQSVEMIHVNFTGEMICALGLLYNNVCDFDQALPYLQNMIDAAEETGAHVRILIKPGPIDGVESSVNLGLLNDELEERGIGEQVEIRFFNGPVHTKATLIDNEFLIVGSQNMHYSAFGDGSGLTEYNMGTSDPQAIEDFQRLFDYHWERSTPSAQEE